MGMMLRALRALEDALVLFLLFAMMAVAGWQIVARNVFDVGLTWAEPSLRIMVLWLGLLGAMVATREQRHITVDVITQWLGPRGARFIARFNNAVCAAVCGIIAWHAWRYVQLDREFPVEGALGIPTWMLALILPIGFGVMALRFALHALAGRLPAKGAVT